jgi:hypothetical protein
MFRWGEFNWERISGVALDISVADKNNIVMCDEQGSIYRYEGDNQWGKLPGTASKVSIGDDGDIWCLNKEGEIYHYVESKKDWAKLPGAAAEITVGNKRMVFVLNKDGDVYQYTGKTGDDAWVKVVTLAKSFSIASDGTLTATSKDDRLLVTFVK